jgi:hypothetical protein
MIAAMIMIAHKGRASLERLTTYARQRNLTAGMSPALLFECSHEPIIGKTKS